MYPDYDCFRYILMKYSAGDDLLGAASDRWSEEEIAFNVERLAHEGCIFFDPVKLTLLKRIEKKGYRLIEVFENDRLYSQTMHALSGFRNITVDIFISTAEKIKMNTR